MLILSSQEKQKIFSETFGIFIALVLVALCESLVELVFWQTSILLNVALLLHTGIY